MANSSPSPIRVAAVGTGNVGKHALTQLINDDRFDLTAVWVSSGAKAGKDAADLAGLPGSTGILATTDLDAVIATKPACVVYTALADNRLIEALEDYRKILAAGINVVGSSAVFLQYPWQVIPTEMVTPIEAARPGWPAMVRALAAADLEELDPEAAAARLSSLDPAERATGLLLAAALMDLDLAAMGDGDIDATAVFLGRLLILPYREPLASLADFDLGPAVREKRIALGCDGGVL